MRRFWFREFFGRLKVISLTCAVFFLLLIAITQLHDLRDEKWDTPDLIIQKLEGLENFAKKVL